MKHYFFFLLLLILGWPLFCSATTEEGIPLLKAPIHPNDLASLQRGAKMYINYCSGCHSLGFMRYNRAASDMGIVDVNGKPDKAIIQDNLIFTGAGIADTLRVAMQKNEAKQWFGVAPPDLSLITRSRGVDWLYTYLLSFYEDETRPLGVNNLLFNETAMPDVLVNLRGTVVPLYKTEAITMAGQTRSIHQIERLVLQKQGNMSFEQFETSVTDLVNFLAYVAEPAKRERERLGFWVLGFLIIFAVLAYFLKKEYWRDIN